MSVFLPRTHLNSFIIFRNSNFLQSPETIVSSRRWISINSVSVDSNSNSFVVSYLINSCGLSPELALSASKRVDFKTSNKPEAVLSFLYDDLGLSKAEVSKVVKRYPRILLCDPHDTISPKVEFLRTKGASIPQIAKLVVRCPSLVHRSLTNVIIPNFNFLRCFLQSDQEAVVCLLYIPFNLFLTNIATRMTPKINFLRHIGVPESGIVLLIKYYPNVFCMLNLAKFKELVEQVREMGIDISNGPIFVKALITIKGLGKSLWKRKVDVYKSWDLSEEEVFAAFRKEPLFMLKSEKKIMAVMDLFIDKLGWEPSVISRNPFLLLFSLEKRLIPRALVLQFLLSKGLIKNDFRNGSFFTMTDAEFVKKYVDRYNEAPEILKVFRSQDEKETA